MNAQATPPTILDRMNAAIASVGVVEKDKTNPHFRYDYLSEEAVKRIAAKACKEHGIAPKTISFTIYESITVERFKGGEKVGEEHRVTMCCLLTWEDGYSAEGWGCGMDPGDKAIMKAQTSAIREAWKNRLCIATGHDPEADGDTDERAKPQPEQRPAPTSAPAAAPRQQASAQRQQPPKAPPQHEIVPFGRNKGQHISQVDDRDLQYLAESARKALNDPVKARFHDVEQRRLDAIEREQDARRAMAAGAAGTRHVDNSEGQPPPVDDIPF